MMKGDFRFAEIQSHIDEISLIIPFEYSATLHTCRNIFMYLSPPIHKENKPQQNRLMYR